MASTINVPRLIPAVPDELGKLIIQQLSFHELAAGYFVSQDWRKFIDNDDVLREKMFRPPKAVEQGGCSDTMNFVRDKWRSINAEFGDEVSFEEFWSRIAINPLVQRESMDDHCDVEDLEKHLSFRDQLPAHHRRESENLFNSMFATYPPLARVQYKFRWPSHINSLALNCFGLRVKDLPFKSNHFTTQLWPEKLWRMFGDLGKGEDNESSGEESAEEDVEADVEENRGNSGDGSDEMDDE
ncbi:hypothetical protein BDU57DRAFT_564749 [Ampelomyces quisqualis]|uniref:F-box domain-containing protein n=1 Tax=Ampelomyces quisqualis TaxID=50730 RepID=A0A6A5Q9Q1_AMPQU|nr:hypothetical protein BDU57DRAFT_564749 [Ampelomyces quisqualis]